MTKFSIEKTAIIILALVLIILGGISSYFHMPRAEDPGFKIRTAVIETQFPGANPQRVELLVTDKIEEAIQEIPQIDYIKSLSKTGLSIIYVNIEEKYKNMKPIWDDLRVKVKKAEIKLPEDAGKPIVNDEFGDVFGSIVTIIGDGYTYKELKAVADKVKDEFLRIDNVAKVEIHGNQKEVIFLEYNTSRLAELKLSSDQLKQILKSRNILISGGSIKVQDKRLVLEPSGNYESVDDIKKTVIKLEGNDEIVYLGDIVNVQRGYVDPPDRIVHSSGQKALMLAVSMKEKGNIIKLGKDIKAKIKQLKNIYPIGIEFDIISSQSDYVQKLTDSFILNLVQSVLVVILLMLLILGPCIGSIIASLIPITILMSFLIMHQISIGIDKISLAALIISLGILVDNSIVIAESIMVKIDEGMSKKNAILKSASEFQKPLLIATLSTSAAFLPVFLAESTAGEYCANLFKVVSITLLSSWVLALTVIPMFCNFLLEENINGENVHAETYNTKFYQIYRNCLITILQNSKKSVIVICMIFLLSIGIFNLFVPKIFFPSSDRTSFQVELKAPIGTAIEKTEKIVYRLEQFFKENLMATANKEGILNWSVCIGQGMPRYVLSSSPEPPEPSYAGFIINTNTYYHLDSLINKTRQFCLENFPDINPIVKKVPLGPPYDAPVEIRVSGKNKNIVFEYVEEIKKKLSSIKGVSQISDNWGVKTQKIKIEINPAKAQRASITNRDIAVSLQSAFSGFEISKYREGSDIIPIIYRSTQNYREDLGKVETLNVYSQLTGRSIPLKQVADISIEWQYPEIKRRNRYQTVTIQSELSDKNITADNIIAKITPWLETQSAKWDIGYFWEIGGSVEKSSKSNNSINDKLPFAFLIISLMLMIHFNSFKKLIIVFLNNILALIGAFIGLWLTNSYFGFITLLGVISLFGIVSDNSVVLLDRINIEEEENAGENPQRALVMASQKRLRPIMLTATTTIGGLSPLWLSNDPMFAPMAITIIFGLFGAVFFTLLVVPLSYSLIFKLDFHNYTYKEVE